MTQGSPWCPRCGVRGRHADALECISVLREQVAIMGLKAENLPSGCARANQSDQKCRGQKTPRFKQIVRLDGQHMLLEVAAARLGISASALYFRIRKRTRNNHYTVEVDIRAIGADVSQRPWISARGHRSVACGEQGDADLT